MRNVKTLLLFCVFILLCGFWNASRADPQVGWY